jgi:hypothetical protein
VITLQIDALAARDEPFALADTSFPLTGRPTGQDLGKALLWAVTGPWSVSHEQQHRSFPA